MVFAKEGRAKFTINEMRDNMKYDRTEDKKVDKRLLYNLSEEEQDGKGKWEAKGGSDVKSLNSRARQTWPLTCVPTLTQPVLM